MDDDLTRFPTYPAMTGAELRAVREQANMTQAELGGLFLLSRGYISQLERGDRKASGATLTIYHLLRRKGVELFL